MTNEEQAFLLILKDAIHPCAEISVLPTSDFEAILNVARKQNMFSLIYDALAKYPGSKEFIATIKKRVTLDSGYITESGDE